MKLGLTCPRFLWSGGDAAIRARFAAVARGADEAGLAGEEKPYEGRHYRLERTLNSPQALSRPHPPIVIGGSGEKKTLRLVAEYADACNFFYGADVRHKLEVLRGHCERLRRPFDSLEKNAAPADTRRRECRAQRSAVCRVRRTRHRPRHRRHARCRRRLPTGASRRARPADRGNRPGRALTRPGLPDPLGPSVFFRGSGSSGRCPPECRAYRR